MPKQRFCVSQDVFVESGGTVRMGQTGQVVDAEYLGGQWWYEVYFGNTGTQLPFPECNLIAGWFG